MRVKNRDLKMSSAISLVETLISISVFAFVAVSAFTILNNQIKNVNKIHAQAFLYTETQNLMNQIASLASAGAVDYEAYYAQHVQNEGLANSWNTPDFGFYAKTFYNPGENGGPYSGPYNAEGISGYGSFCPDGDGVFPKDCPNEFNPYAGSADVFTGSHPFEGIEDFPLSPFDPDTDSMNAFCEDTSPGICGNFSDGIQKELIILDASGTRRTVFARETFHEGAEDHFLSSVELEGFDLDSNGSPEVWECSSAYECDGRAGRIRIPSSDDLFDSDDLSDLTLQNDFLPLSPRSLNIENFTVIISPLENPSFAFSEENTKIQTQVTIIMTVTLSDEYSKSFLGETPKITLQRSISTRTYSSVNDL